MHDTNNDSKLHLVGIEEKQHIVRNSPHRVDPKRVDAILLPIEICRRVHRVSFPVLPSLLRTIAAAEEVRRNGRKIIVDEPAVERKEAHQQKQVPRRQSSSQQVVLRALDVFSVHHHVRADAEQSEAVPDISEHDSEKERESRDRKDAWVHLLVPWDTVGVYDFLESRREFVRL